ncbi:hypothetical protein [Pseudomonas bananamidigenes]|uniref:hypothetical protein n=1 Tax=Pseudomonas bananamidigenes TaxID=2843610 RepID=UPI001CECEE9D|nr:hypothetical protein [Pseudomonas bananamidigenes]
MIARDFDRDAVVVICLGNYSGCDVFTVTNGRQAIHAQKRKIGESEKQHQIPDKKSWGDTVVLVQLQWSDQNNHL